MSGLGGMIRGYESKIEELQVEINQLKAERLTNKGLHISDVEWKVQERLEELEAKGLHDPAIRIAFDELQKLQIWLLEGIEY